MEIQSVREPVREHRSLFAHAEKRILVWIAYRLPRWVTSDQLTLLGLLSMLAAGCFYWAAGSHKWALPCVVASSRPTGLETALTARWRESETRSGRATAFMSITSLTWWNFLVARRARSFGVHDTNRGPGIARRLLTWSPRSTFSVHSRSIPIGLPGRGAD